MEDRIDALEESLATAEETIEALRMLLADILQEIRTSADDSPAPPDEIPPEKPTAAECHAEEKVLVGDRCENCPTNMQFSENQCVDIPPTAAECHAMQKILVNDNCESCSVGEQFSENQCVAIPTTADDCHAINQILVNGNCENCPTNMQFSENQCVDIPMAATECHAMQKILVNDNCESCEADEQFNTATNRCDALPPTAADCHAEEKVLVGDSCQNCSVNMVFIENQCVVVSTAQEMCNANGMTFTYFGNGRFSCRQCSTVNLILKGNVCTPTVESCHAVDMVLHVRSGTTTCRECPSDRPREGNACLGDEEMCIAINRVFMFGACRPTAATCHALGRILVGGSLSGSCESCPEDMQFKDNKCVAADSKFITVEYRANSGLEYINVLYAYDRGYFGQGVTVVNMERVLASHEDLRANVLTMDINVDYSDTDFSNFSNYDFDGDAWDEYYAKYNGDRFAKEYLNFLVNDLGRDIDESRFDVVFHGTATGGIIVAEKNNIGGHGVAPQAKLIPIPLGGFRSARYFSGDPTKSNTTDLQYIIDNKIPIVNHSIWLNSRIRSGLVDYELVKDSDSIFVWSSGNRGRPHSESDNNHITLPFNIPDLEDNWLIVQGYYPKVRPEDDRTESERKVGISCGDVKQWCVTGSSSFDTVPIGPNDDDYFGLGATSAAAPSVSGALAVLKSAAPEMPMTAIRAILLTTATDIGDPGIDEVYGWGFVNISAGITLIESMQTEAMAGLSSVPFANLRGELPSGFSHMHDDFSELSIAIKLTDNLHYNIGLGDMMAANNDAPEVPLGDGATDMLADAESDSRRGFFAYGDIDSEMGLRYYGGTGGFSYVAEGQHATTNQRYFNGNFGSLGGVSGKVYSGKVGFVRDINMAGMQVFGDYERAAVGGDGDEGNLIVGVRDARAESWMAGMSFSDIWKYGDKIRLSARQEMGLSGGDLIVRYPHAVGDFHKTFIGEGTQEIEVREAFLPLKQKALMLYTAGYSQKFTAKSEWAAALEYNAGNNAKALSLIWQGEF